MAENKLADLSMDFAVSILKVTDGIMKQNIGLNLCKKPRFSLMMV